MVKERLFVIDTDPFDFLSDGLDELSENLDDMRPLFEGFASDFYKDEKRVFKSPKAPSGSSKNPKGPSEYKDLSPKYKKYKIKKKGKAYPILLFDGDLAKSLLTRNATGSFLKIGKEDFQIGTTIDHAIYHMTGTKKMPRRPLWFIGDNTPLQARWLRTLDVYIDKAIAGAFDSAGS